MVEIEKIDCRGVGSASLRFEKKIEFIDKSSKSVDILPSRSGALGWGGGRRKPSSLCLCDINFNHMTHSLSFMSLLVLLFQQNPRVFSILGFFCFINFPIYPPPPHWLLVFVIACFFFVWGFRLFGL